MNQNQKSNLVSLKEFQSLAGIEASKTIKLLEEGALPVVLTEGARVMIDLNQVQYDEIALKAISHNIEVSNLPTDPEVVQEIISAEILREMEAIVEEAISLAVEWAEQPVDNSTTETEPN